jgi:hypothetical protein
LSNSCHIYSISVQRASAKRRGLDKKMRLAEVVVARESDLGVNDTQHTCVTHLGHILKEGINVCVNICTFLYAIFGKQNTCATYLERENIVYIHIYTSQSIYVCL